MAQKRHPLCLNLAALLLATWLGGCASSPEAPSGPSFQGDRALLEKSEMGQRRVAGVAQGITHWARSTIIDPVLRPVSNQKSLAALVVKSAAGFVHRAGTNVFRFPLLEHEPIPPLANHQGMDLIRWEKDLDGIVGTRAHRGRIRFLVDGEEFFPRMIETVEQAEESIDVRTYIFDNDDYAVSIADLLKARAAEVKVRVMVDGLGYLAAQQVDSPTLPSGFTPPLSMVNYLRQDSKVRVRVHANPWFTGDHSKATIIDGEFAFVGGMNIGREYRHDWHDLMMEVRGPVVDVLQHDLDKAWAKSGLLGEAALFARLLVKAKGRASEAGYPIRVLHTLDHNSQIYRAQLAAIRRAQSRIYIQNAYFSDDLVLYELAGARRRGVDVRVILPSKGDDEILNWSNWRAVNVMLRHGIRVYLYPGMTHVKAAVYDGWACSGSANFDKLSLQVNRELNLATSHAETVQRLVARVFLPDFARSEEVLEPLKTGIAHGIAEVLSDELL